MKSLVLSFVILLVSTLLSSAGQVIWGSARFADNFTSEGPPSRVDSSFTFELGGFVDDFVPTSANLDEWRLHWVAAQSSDYSDEAHFFTGSYVTPQNEAPFRPADQGYFWGYNRLTSTAGEEARGEWILITNPDWHWPSGGTVAPPVQWSVSNATEAIVGAIHPPDDAFHFQTASVPLPISLIPSPSDWWLQHFPDQTETSEGWEADAEGDGLPNLVEYALGSLPHVITALPEPERIQVDEETYWQFEIDRVEQTSVQLSAETSADLIEWSSESSDIEMIELSSTQLIIRMRDEEGSRFIRLSARFP